MRAVKIISYALQAIVAVYLLLPSASFPVPPPDFVQSQEPADTESIYRRGYYTNLDRQQVVDYYHKQFSGLFSYKLNYPPEEAYPLVRDQTRSTFLEEIVHPFRESIYINGFHPSRPADQMSYKGIVYPYKIVVRHTPSHVATRLTVMLMTVVCIKLLFKEYANV